jgi:isocitrate dehydrogenase kinase/phosphatase
MGVIEGVAQTILDGFNRHYFLFRQFSSEASGHFERSDWKSAAEANTARIKGYDQRVNETVEALNDAHPAASTNDSLWPTIKMQYIALLLDHPQVECAETFFNSVACRVLHRRYYKNDYIFWRPTLSTEHLEGTNPAYRSYYPRTRGLRRCLLEMIADLKLDNPFENLRRDLRYLERILLESRPKDWKANPNHQFQVLGSLFFRNKAAYIVGRQINGEQMRPLVIPILQNRHGSIFIDTLLERNRDVAILFSFSRAYFMVDMDVPSAYVSFLLSIMPTKPPVDLYAMLGLQKHAKTLFYRELHHHLKHSQDNFIIAPGIPGMVMLVFTLPSFPFVFKVIRDRFEPPKKTSRGQVREKYQLVKFHDRVGRLADTLEYSNVAIPRDRIDPELMDEFKRAAPSSVEVDGDIAVIKHLYIERRMVPLNEYLAQASRKQCRKAIIDYGEAIRDLAGANIFPGDMMHKNFGVTRYRRVVFYDYDEICYMTDCNFRKIPPAPDIVDEMSSEPWYSMEEHDVFPETFGSFFFPDQKSREFFYQYHKELVEPEFWNSKKNTILEGGQADVFPYPHKRRFALMYGPPG